MLLLQRLQLGLIRVQGEHTLILKKYPVSHELQLAPVYPISQKEQEVPAKPIAQSEQIEPLLH